MGGCAVCSALQYNLYFLSVIAGAKTHVQFLKTNISNEEIFPELICKPEKKLNI